MLLTPWHFRNGLRNWKGRLPCFEYSVWLHSRHYTNAFECVGRPNLIKGLEVLFFNIFVDFIINGLSFMDGFACWRFFLEKEVVFVCFLSTLSCIFWLFCPCIIWFFWVWIFCFAPKKLGSPVHLYASTFEIHSCMKGRACMKPSQEPLCPTLLKFCNILGHWIIMANKYQFNVCTGLTTKASMCWKLPRCFASETNHPIDELYFSSALFFIL